MSDLDKVFFINQRLELAPYDALEYLHSRIEDFSGVSMIVAMPMRNSVPVYLPVGSALFGRALAGEGIMYSFDTVLLAYTTLPLPIWTIRRPVNIKRVQQRSFFRYPISLLVRSFLVNEETNALVEDSETVSWSQNLSAGGVMLLIEKTIPLLGSKIWVEIPLGKTGIIVKSVAVVVRVDIKKTNSAKTFYSTAVRFINMDENIRKKIVGFLNSCLTEDRQRGFGR